MLRLAGQSNFREGGAHASGSHGIRQGSFC
jgi:hypothetical protein